MENRKIPEANNRAELPSSSTSESQVPLDSSTPSSQPDGSLPPAYQLSEQAEEIVQVVYQSNLNGSLVGVETSLIGGTQQAGTATTTAQTSTFGANCVTPTTAGTMAINSGPNLVTKASPSPSLNSLVQQPTRVATTLPSVAEESTSSGHAMGGQSANFISSDIAQEFPSAEAVDVSANDTVIAQVELSHVLSGSDHPTTGAPTTATATAATATGDLIACDPIYSTINKRATGFGKKVDTGIFSPTSALSTSTDDSQKSTKIDEPILENQVLEKVESSLLAESIVEEESPKLNDGRDTGAADASAHEDNNAENAIMWRQKQGAAESGSFRRNHHKKKLGLSISSNETDLITHRQKFIEATESNTSEISAEKQAKADESSDSHLSISKFKRTHSVSFNVNSSRSNRHSVDIRNLPSYLTHKRTSIVDVARGAMSSLISSLSGSANASVISSGHRRDSSPEEEPIFEEPIAPTLSLGQRVALVRESGAEFGTVGWIGQLPDIDDDWIVGVIFDNMIGNCDGAYNGVRYFYAQENYAMFVPLSLLTKTDNYIGRPETGTMLSRMSVQLKPGQLISIQRSSIRLQHCFLNAPHQRVGHDVRAVSNRLHCQCHNCGPCAHLTKQGRPFVLPHFGSHHIPHKSKNSLARAAVELLAHHHHHHFHDEEEHHENEEDCHFGDNSAHACNYVRYSCCKQNGVGGHEFLNDCEMVRPELLDNLIHAPKAPHRRSHSRRRRSRKDHSTSRQQSKLQFQQREMLAAPETDYNNADSNQSTLDKSYTGQVDGSGFMAAPQRAIEQGASSASGMSPLTSPERTNYTNEGVYQYDSTMSYRTTGVYNTIDSQVSMMDQQRYIYQRDSSAMIGQQRAVYNDDTASEATSDVGLSKRILRCLGCLRNRTQLGRRGTGRSKGRRLSARDRLIEYRRRQSTFVPSTLAKPHEDFASHGIIFPPEGGNMIGDGANSDYSSYSRSSCSSSRSSSPDNEDGRCGIDQQPKVDVDQLAANIDQQLQTMLTFEQGNKSNNDQLKSCSNVDAQTELYEDQPVINYGDYVSNSSYGSFKKSARNQQSDLGFSEAYTNCSSDTLKNLVDQSINQEVSMPEPIVAGGPNEHLIISPLPSATGSFLSDELIDISSPTESCDRCENERDQSQVEDEVEEQEGEEADSGEDECMNSIPYQEDS